MSDLDDMEEFAQLPDLSGWTKPGTYNRLKTHCSKGHPLDEKNTKLVNRGGRIKRSCKICHRAHVHRRLKIRLAEDPAFKEKHNIRMRDSMRRVRAAKKATL